MNSSVLNLHCSFFFEFNFEINIRTSPNATDPHQKPDKPKVELLVQTNENGQPEWVAHAQVAESQEMIFQCRIKSNPPVIQIGWIFKNKPLINDARNGELSFDSLRSNNHLDNLVEVRNSIYFEKPHEKSFQIAPCANEGLCRKLVWMLSLKFISLLDRLSNSNAFQLFKRPHVGSKYESLRFVDFMTVCLLRFVRSFQSMFDRILLGAAYILRRESFLFTRTAN